ncbi:hypothetical protein R70723_10220 [Paenibacillus sp. FSL R7-0273]|nr:hypothetical protein R70723_10220 [Paenibacillus sp. FSL R7-0273]
MFNADEVERLRTKIGLVSQDTNRLYLQLRGQSGTWSGIPLGSSLQQAQVLINELTSEAEKLEDLIRSAVQGFQGVQAENKREADQLSRQLGVLAGLFGSAGNREAFRPISIPTLAQKAVTSFIRTLSMLSGRDELSSDPAVQKLRGIIQQSGLASIEGLSAQVKLKEIYEAREQIAKAQTAYEVYQTFGNQAQMAAAHQQAEEARRKLKSMGISAKQYEAGKDLTGYFRQAAIKACDYDPSVIDKRVPLPENEEYAFLLRMAMEPGIQGEWAKQQLALVKPEATLGPVDRYNSVSEADILNRNDPEAIGRLKETYWFTLAPEEQDRRYEELKAYYEKQEKEAADKNRLTGSGVGNQTLANILVGGSNMIVNAIDTASFGIARTVTDWITGPKPEDYVSPLDEPYGKTAGQVAGGLISIGLPWKYLGSGMQATGAVGKFSPTLYKSMVSGAISGTVGEAFDAVNDYRDDGKQSLGERLISVGVNTLVAGAGDVLITTASKGLAGIKKIVNGSIPEVKVKEVEGTGKAKTEIDGAAKELEDVRVVGTRQAPKRFGEPPIEPKLKIDVATENKAEMIRANGLDNIEEFAKNTGLSFEEAKNLKSHMFLNEYELCHYDQKGLYYYKSRLTPDSEVVYAFTKAQTGELTPQGKGWFKQLAAHELAEKKLMESGLSYRHPDSWEGMKFSNDPPGAHDLAPKQPDFGSFPGYEENVAKFYNLRWSELYD